MNIPASKQIHTSCTIDPEIVAMMDAKCNLSRDDPAFECSRSSIISKALRRYFNLPSNENETDRTNQRVAVSRANRKATTTNQNA